MRVSIVELIHGDPQMAGAAAVEPVPAASLTRLLQPFHVQSVAIRSIMATGCDELFPLTAMENSHTSVPAHFECDWGLPSLARLAREHIGPRPGYDLVILPERMLEASLTPLSQDFPLRAAVAIFEPGSGEPSNSSDWRLRRNLFDRGLICIGSAPFAGRKALCFLASDAVRSFNQLDVESRGLVSMSVLVLGARFANQLFRYACVKLYALRHGLTPALPSWVGNELFGLIDKPCDGLELPRVVYPGFALDDREIWEQEDPTINVDLVGYFQEIPECWRRHRQLLRRMFQLPAEQLEAIEAWRHAVTKGGRRTLVAVHLRRGDYRNFPETPYFRIIPEEWYLDWLRAIWPTLSDPVLFVGTDEPDAILPKFQEFETVSSAFGGAAQGLPADLRDFEVMRRADYLAICNSSFGRMSAILASPNQKCFIASVASDRFEAYEPWIDPSFWTRFADADRPHKPATIHIDVSDLLFYLLNHQTFSGIQRVECEILRNLVDLAQQDQLIRFIVLNKRGELGAIDTSRLMAVIEDIRAGILPKTEIESKLRLLAQQVSPCSIGRREIFLTLGAFWNTKGMGVLLQKVKNSGGTIGIFIHDMLPFTTPEYFEAVGTRVFVKAITEALTFADFVLTTTEYNKTSVANHLAARKLPPLPIHTIPLARGLSLSAPDKPKISEIVAEILETDYVLCVGTIEVRKNPVYLFNIWKMMVRSGRPAIPKLVLVGRRGWLVQDFFDQLKACNYLDGRIQVVHNATDVELDLLYKKCMLTMLPSFVEGWGLPVGESLAHGKICLCSALGGIPEAGGELADYLDPYNALDGLEKLTRYLENPELRRLRELQISERFESRSWTVVADDLLSTVQALAQRVPVSEGVAAITLPRDRFMDISVDFVSTEFDGLDGGLSAELICVSGWHPTEKSGARAAQATAMVRFRADAAPGTKVNLVLRLAAFGRDFRIRICPGSGDESVVSLSNGGRRIAVVPCHVEAGNLITVQLSSVSAMLDDNEFPGATYWMLEGLLYFDPKRPSPAQAKGLKKRPHVVESRTEPSRSPAPAMASQQPNRQSAIGERILLRPTGMAEGRLAPSLGVFLETTNCYWPSASDMDRDAPIFADLADRRAFYSGCGKLEDAPKVGRTIDDVKLVRRSDQFLSISRFSEGSIFDREGVWRAYGYLHGSPPAHTPWLSVEPDGVSVARESLASADYYQGSYLVFYNGNLQNYYHWVVEGLLTLDILSRALGSGKNLKIAMPKSVEIAAVFDHRETLRAVDLAADRVVEVAGDFIRVQEAIWVESDQVQTMPAQHLKDFQQRISALYLGQRNPRRRRLLVARKGPARTIQNMAQVENFLSRFGFETVHLEGMSMRDQILLFQSAEYVISPHGAGLANLLFCEPGTKVIELMPSCELRPFFWLIAEKLGLTYAMQFCESTAGMGFQGAITVDIAKLQALIRMVDAHL